MKLHKSLSLAVSLPAAAVVVLGVAPQAQADAGTGCSNYSTNCGIFYYNTGFQGSRTAFRWDSVPDLAGYKFLTSGAGQGLYVKNNAASFYNSSDKLATIFYNSNYGGACDTVAAWADAYQLRNTYNENASLGFGKSGYNCYKF
ncbi:hypothetical protein GCM10020367_46500 [Streptomyces sannanensis]|uniref:Peptidase inhibitor family I36 n=1 Tax=Streptomyces sannanensis TaxID=285536 RepID=A0ABP6SGX7_9ACTN